MDLFQDRQHVRLRIRAHGTYLHADGDGQGVSLRGHRASMNAAWAVHTYPGDGNDQYVLLHSAAYGGYLAVTDAPALRGHRFEQSDHNDLDGEDIRWEAFRIGSGDDVQLRHVTGRCLCANGSGRYLPWNNCVCVDGIDNAGTTMHWVVERIPARDCMPRLPCLTELLFLGRLADMLPSRVVRYVRTDADGTQLGRAAFEFNGRSVSRLRKQLARRLGGIMDISNLAMCVQAGNHGRPTPLVVDLPRSGQVLQILVFEAGTPVHMALRYPDVDA